MWKRFFCGGAPTTIDESHNGEWVIARTQLLQTQALHCKAKVLDVVEDEIEEIHRNVGGKKVALRASTMRRLHRANLPMEESQRATELLGKITALDRARIDLERKCTELSYALAAAEESKRLAEFDAEKAHAMTRARGEVLARQHQRIVETEAYQTHLIDMLHTALAQLGMSIEEIKGISEQTKKEVEDSAREPQIEDSAAFVVVQHDNNLIKNRENGDNNNSDKQKESPISPHTFTIYSNDLSDTPPAVRDAMLDADNNSDQLNSATKWKDISEAAALSPNAPSIMTTPVNQQLHSHHYNQHNMQLPATVERRAKRLAHLIVPQLKPDQLASLVQLGSKASSPSAITPNTQRQMLQIVYSNENEDNANVVAQKEGMKKTTTAKAVVEKKQSAVAKKSAAVAAPRFSTFNTTTVLTMQPEKKNTAVNDHNGNLIKAVNNNSNADKEYAARQQRAMERLKARLNSKLPPNSQLKDSDMLGFAVTASGKKKKSPKGSLRERAEKEARALFISNCDGVEAK